VKPPPFEYRRPASVQDVAALLAEHGEDAKILAGGQTLVPMMNFRLVAPAIVVDINDVAGLDRIELRADTLRLGALVRWHQLETDPTVARANPMLAEAVRHIAHYQIRNRGTWAGSCAHADPAAEFPAVALISDARFGLYSSRGRRELPADEFFLGPLTTALAPDEMLVDVEMPAWPADRQWAFEEFALRSGDFAIAGVAVSIDPTLGTGGIRFVAFGVGERPRRLRNAEAAVAKFGLTGPAIAQAAAAAAEEVDAQSDIHAPADYRRSLVGVLLERAVRRATGIGGKS
jgi:carbon-monoxide dehydrogenase medium subunit